MYDPRPQGVTIIPTGLGGTKPEKGVPTAINIIPE